MASNKRSLRDFIRAAQGKAGAVMGPTEAEKQVTTKKPVFYTSAVMLCLFSAWTLLDPKQAGEVISRVVKAVGHAFGAYYILLATAIIVFVLVIAFSRWGNMRLGPDDSRPQFSTFSWAAMLFAAGIGTDIMFFSVAEPITQYVAPPNMKPETIEAARMGVVWTLFHYGLTGWGMYALMGMALAYFAYRRKMPLSVRSALYPLFGKRVNGAVGHFVDASAIVGTIFGIAVTLGIGVVQLNYGLKILFGLPENIAVQSALVAVAIIMSTVSATTGVEKGIRFLSQLNVVLAILLVLWVLVTGQTVFFLNALVMNVGDLLANFPQMTLDTMAYRNPAQWMNDWTLFFWAWWVAWASFIGLFLARISRGRTIRQFVFGCLVFPFLYALMWISVFGNAALKAVRDGDTKLVTITLEAPEHGFYYLIQQYPMPMMLVAVSTVVGLLFYVTSADSGALVMANLCSNLPTPNHDARKGQRIFWAVITGVLTLGVLIVGGIPALQQATIVMGLPFSFVLIAVMAGLVRAIRHEEYADSVHARALLNMRNGQAMSHASTQVNWQDRLWKALDWVTLPQAQRALEKTVVPAMQRVVDELASKGLDATILYDQQGLDALNLDDDTMGAKVYKRVFFVVNDQKDPFFYEVSLTEVSGVAYAAFVGRAKDTTVRLEVTVVGIDDNYDIVGYSGEQVIYDIVRQFERFVEFRLLRHEMSVDKAGKPGFRQALERLTNPHPASDQEGLQ